jgi:hypothetical protein
MRLRSGPADGAGGRLRRLGLAAGLIAVLALAAGCSSSPGSSGTSTSGVHLTYALWDPVQEVGYKKSIALFEAPSTGCPRTGDTEGIFSHKDYFAAHHIAIRPT